MVLRPSTSRQLFTSEPAYGRWRRKAGHKMIVQKDKLIQANDCKEQKSAWNTWKNEYADLLRVEIKTFGAGVPTLCLCCSAAWFFWLTAVSNKMFGTNYYGGNVYHPRPWIKWHTPCSPLLGKVSIIKKKNGVGLLQPRYVDGRLLTPNLLFFSMF